MQTVGRGWQEFWAEFFRIRHLHSLPGIEEWDRSLVSHVVATLKLAEGDRILDLACGGGDQARELARRGMTVVGVDLARSLVDRGNEAAAREGLPVRLVPGDMREPGVEGGFDAAVILSGSFGFFDDAGNARVLAAIRKALRPGGGFYLQLPPPGKRDRPAWKGWDEVDGGFLLMESEYDPVTGRVVDGFRYLTADGEMITYEPGPGDEGFSLSTRLYTLVEVIGLIEAAGLGFDAAYGSLALPPEEYRPGAKSLIVTGRRV